MLMELNQRAVVGQAQNPGTAGHWASPPTAGSCSDVAKSRKDRDQIPQPPLGSTGQ